MNQTVSHRASDPVQVVYVNVNRDAEPDGSIGTVYQQFDEARHARDHRHVALVRLSFIGNIAGALIQEHKTDQTIYVTLDVEGGGGSVWSSIEHARAARLQATDVIVVITIGTVGSDSVSASFTI